VYRVGIVQEGWYIPRVYRETIPGYIHQYVQGGYTRGV